MGMGKGDSLEVTWLVVSRGCCAFAHAHHFNPSSDHECSLYLLSNELVMHLKAPCDHGFGLGRCSHIRQVQRVECSLSTPSLRGFAIAAVYIV